MKTLTCCEPRQSVLDGSEDFVVNRSALPELSEAEAREFLDSNVLTSGMQDLVMQACLEQRKGRVQRGTISRRIPFCNLRYDEGVEQRLFNVLTGRIREITNIFGTIPDFITDQWVKAMLENRALSESDVIQIVAAEPRSPFAVKETYEYLDEEWESTAEVLNSTEALKVFLEGW